MIFEAMSVAAQRLPPSLLKVRIGRGVAAIAGLCGLDPVCAIRLTDGSRVELDPRSRTEAGAFWNGEYEVDYVHALEMIIDILGTTVYDIGANVGLITVPLARYVAPTGTVVAFEPISENLDRLSRSLRLNDLTPSQVRTFNVALGATEAEIEMAREGRLGATSGNAVPRGAVAINERWRERWHVQRVRVRRLDDVVKQESLPLPHVVKIDVEGAEAEVLRGGRLTFAEARPVILGEFNAAFMQAYGDTFLDVADLLPPEYAIYSFVEARTLVRRTASVDLGDVLLVPREHVAKLPLDVVAG